MSNYAVGSSVLHRQNYPPTYDYILGLVTIRSYHVSSCLPLMFALNTIVGVHYETKGLSLGPNERIVFNFGQNDLIYRKDPAIARLWQILDTLSQTGSKDDMGHFYYGRALEQWKTKKPETLVQLLSPAEFETLTDEVFSWFKGKGIVMSTNYFDKNCSIGYSYNENVLTNQILERLAKKHGLQYIDFWKPEFAGITHDHVHFTVAGHAFAAQKIKEAILASGGTIH